MNLYLLRPVKESEFSNGNWDVHLKFIVRAGTEVIARQMVERESGFQFWLNPEIISCTLLTDGEEEGILFSEKKFGFNKFLST